MVRMEMDCNFKVCSSVPFLPWMIMASSFFENLDEIYLLVFLAFFTPLWSKGFRRGSPHYSILCDSDFGISLCVAVNEILICVFISALETSFLFTNIN